MAHLNPYERQLSRINIAEKKINVVKEKHR